MSDNAGQGSGRKNTEKLETKMSDLEECGCT